MSINKASSAPTPVADHGEEEKEIDCTDPKEEGGVEELDKQKKGASVINKMQVEEVETRFGPNQRVNMN